MRYAPSVLPRRAAPLDPFGWVALLCILFLAWKRWHRVRLAYHRGWWPSVSVAASVVLGALMYPRGRWLFPAPVV